MRTFALYPVERPGPGGKPTWFPFSDYGAVLDIVVRLRPSSVLEFGPGASTLALVEGGADSIVTLEDDLSWFERRVAEFAAFPQVSVFLYRHADLPDIPWLAGMRFDFGFVDGPVATEARGAEIAFALARCRAVACHDAGRDGVRQALERCGLPVERLGHSVALVIP